eukprot:EG_transcript_112
MIRRPADADTLHRQVVGCLRGLDVPGLRALRTQLATSTMRDLLANPVPEKVPLLAPEELAQPSPAPALQRRYHARFRLLSALLELLSGGLEMDAPEARQALLGVVRDLCEAQLVPNLLASAKALLQEARPQPLFDSHESWVYTERRLVALCLFYVAYSVQISAEEVKELVEVLRLAQLKLTEVESGLQDSAAGGGMPLLDYGRQQEAARDLRNRLNEVCYLLLMAVSNATLPRMAGVLARGDLDNNGAKSSSPAPPSAAVKEGPNGLLGNKALVEWLKQQCAESARWTSPHSPPRAAPPPGQPESPPEWLPYQTLLVLPLSLALDYHQRLSDPDSEEPTPIFDGLKALPLAITHVFDSATFWPDANRRDYQRLWVLVLSQLVHHASDVVMAQAEDEFVLLRDTVNESIALCQRAAVPGAVLPAVPPSLVAPLLRLIGLCHKDLGQPSDWFETTRERARPAFLFREVPAHLKRLTALRSQALAQFHQMEYSGQPPPPREPLLAWTEAFEVAYFDMLADMVDTPDAALAVHGVLADETQVSGLKWHDLFEQLRLELSQTGLESGYADFEQEGPIREGYCAAVLRLFAQVTRHSSVALAQFLRPGDRTEPVDLLLRFLCAAGVHQALAGQVFRTLGALADPRHDQAESDARRQCATLAWLQLDQLEVLVTDPQDPNPNRGMHFDFARECDIRRFPETTGFLEWLVGVMPHLLARPPAGDRWPSFGPYLWFVAGTVFPAVLARQYDREEERWELAAACLSVLEGVLRHYEPDASHFSDGQQVFDVRKRYCRDEEPSAALFPSRLAGIGAALPAGGEVANLTWCGHWLVAELLQAKELLTKVLEIIPRVSVLPPAPGSAAERAALSALRILDALLAKQGPFLSLHAAGAGRTRGAGFLKQLESHLLHMSYYPEQGAGSLLLEVTNFLRLQGSPLQGAAIKVLKRLAASSFDITGVYFRRTDRDQALQLFVRALREAKAAWRTGGAGGAGAEGEAEAGEGPGQVGAAVAELIVLTLRNPLRKAPNLAHFLCGFDLDNPRVLLRTTFEQQRQQLLVQQMQQPHAFPVAIPEATAPESCLDVILEELLQSDIVTQQPLLAELYYEVLYQLVSQPDMAEAIFARLTSLDFFAAQCRVLHKHRSMLAARDLPGRHLTAVYRQRAAILKTIALFLHLQSQPAPAPDAPAGPTGGAASTAQPPSAAVRDVVSWCWDRAAPEAAPLRSLALQCYDVEMQPAGGQTAGQPRAFALEFLNDLDLSLLLERYPLPDVAGAATGLFRQVPLAPQPNARGVEEYNLRSLHQQLLLALKLAGASQTAEMRTEVVALQQQQDLRRVLAAALVANERHELYHAVCSAVEGWAQVVEITTFRASDPHARDLLSGDWVADLEHVVGRVLQRVVAALAQTFPPAAAAGGRGPALRCLRPVQAVLARAASCLMTRLRQRRDGSGGAILFGHDVSSSAVSPQGVLANLIPCIVESTSVKFRANSYAILVNYLEYLESEKIVTLPVEGQLGQALPPAELQRQQAQVLFQETLFQYGPQLIRAIATDAVEAKELGLKAVAWAALDALVRFDAATGRVVRMMDGSTSAMQQVVAAVRNADAALCEALEPYCGDIHAVHVFESIMSLLLSVSQAAGGAQLVQERYHVVGVVSRMQFLQRIGAALQLDGVTHEDPHSNVPSIRTRCSMLLLPVLQLLADVFQRLHRNAAVAEQVADFIARHAKALKAVLRRPHHHGSGGGLDGIAAPALREIYAVTTLLNLAASHRQTLFAKVGPDPVRKFQLLGLLNRFCRREFWQNCVLPNLEEEDPKRAEAERLTIVQRIVRNLVETCSKCCGALAGVKSIDAGGMASQTPIFELAVVKFTTRVEFSTTRTSQEDLALALHTIKGCVDGLQDVNRVLAELERRLQSTRTSTPPQPWKAGAAPDVTKPRNVRATVALYLRYQGARDTLTATLEHALLLLHFHLRLALNSDQALAGAGVPYADQLALVAPTPAGRVRPGLADLKRALASTEVAQLLDAVRSITRPEALTLQQDQERTDFVYRVCELLQAATA